MKKIFKKIKIVAVFVFAALLGFVAPALAATTPVPAGGVEIESTTGILNASAGQTNYQDSVGARTGETVNIHVWYHNPNPPASGDIAENVNVKISLPTQKSTVNTVRTSVGGVNTNTITNTVAVNTSIDTLLQYIPGSAQRRYNTGTRENPVWRTVSIPDSVVTSGYVVSELNPCWEYQESITIQARVTADTISITKQVKIDGDSDWEYEVSAEPGDIVNYLITIKNEGTTRLNNVIVRDSLSPSMRYIAGSARLFNSGYPNGIAISDNIVNGGVNIGNYNPGAWAYVGIKAVVSPSIECGRNYSLRNIGIVRADGMGEYYNDAYVTTNRACTYSEDVSIMIVKFHDRDGDGREDSNEEGLADWRFRVVGPNGFEQIVATDERGMSPITGLSEGNYTVTEILSDGWENTTGLTISRNVTQDPATQTFVFGNRRTTEPPTGGGESLPKSGPAEAAMAFGTFGISGSALAWLKSKKRLLEAFKK